MTVNANTRMQKKMKEPMDIPAIAPFDKCCVSGLSDFGAKMRWENHNTSGAAADEATGVSATVALALAVASSLSRH